MTKKKHSVRIDRRLHAEYYKARIDFYGSPVNNAYKDWNICLKEHIEDMRDRNKNHDEDLYSNTDPQKKYDKQVTIVCDSDLMNQFRSAVIDLHGSIRGNMYLELNLAIKFRIRRLRGEDINELGNMFGPKNL